MIRADFVLSLNESVQVTDMSRIAVVGNEVSLQGFTQLFPVTYSRIMTFNNMNELILKSTVDEIKFDLLLFPFDEISRSNTKHILKKLLNISPPDAYLFLSGKLYSRSHLASGTELTDFIRTCRLLNFNFSITTDSAQNFTILLRKMAFNQNKALDVYFSEMSKNIYGSK